MKDPFSQFHNFLSYLVLHVIRLFSLEQIYSVLITIFSTLLICCMRKPSYTLFYFGGNEITQNKAENELLDVRITTTKR